MNCLLPLTSANGGAGTGSISCVTQRRWATSSITRWPTRGDIAITWSSAFNADVPYGDFVREHIAGDLLKHPRRHATDDHNESIIGTGFWHLHEDVHAPVDVRLSEATRFENQIDVFGKTFLGLTIACARCHDHKFDPITDEDYYALAGFLKSSRRHEAGLDPHGEIEKAAAKLAELRDAIDEKREEFVSADVVEATPLREGDVLFEDFNDESFDDWYSSGWAFGDRALSRSLATGPAPRGRLGKALWIQAPRESPHGLACVLATSRSNTTPS